MKSVGKTIKGVEVFVDSEVPPNKMFLLYGNVIQKNPKRYGRLEGIYEPPKKYGLFRKIKWHLWDSL